MALKNSKTSNNNPIIYAIIGVLLFAVIAMMVYIFNLNKTTAPAAPAAPAVSTSPAASIKNSPTASTSPSSTTSGEETVAATATAAAKRDGMALGKFTGKVPAVIGVLDQLKGFKEDTSVAPEDTVYVIYDPRCPYCHALFDKIHEDVKLKDKGITVKWLPSVALGVKGEDDPVVERAAYGFIAKNLDDFGNSFANKSIPSVKLTDQMKQDLNDNLNFLYEASNKTFGEKAPKSVPAVFFLDKQTGVPQMMYGASDDAVFKNIFGE